MRPVSQLMDLTGRHALMTGGAGNVGLAVGQVLVELGAEVAVLDLEEGACEKRVEELGHVRRGCAKAFPCNLVDERATRGTVKDVLAQFGGLDIMIHCAAYVGTTAFSGWSVPFEEQTVEAWDAAMRVNLTSAFVIVQEAQKALVASGRGSVILFSSIYGIVAPDMRLYTGTPMANPIGYGASKAALLQVTRYLATVLAPRARVNAISLGGVWRSQPEAFHERYVSRTPLGRMAREEDVKGAVAYLAGDMSVYVTGHNLVVDGGWTAW